VTAAQALGRTIVVLRASQGMKRGQLAVRADVSYPYISEIESGIKEPSLPVLRRLGEALGTTAAGLLTRAELVESGGSLVV